LTDLPSTLEYLSCDDNNLPYKDLEGYWKWCGENNINQKNYKEYLLNKDMKKFNI